MKKHELNNKQHKKQHKNSFNLNEKDLLMMQARTDPIGYHGSRLLCNLFLALSACALIGQIYYLSTTTIDIQLAVSNLSFALLTCLMMGYFVYRHHNGHSSNFTIVYLLSTFSLLITLRLSYVANMSISLWICCLAFVICVANFIITSRKDLAESRQQSTASIRHSTRYEWQLLFIRLFIGFDLVPHFCEKLFSGPHVRMEDVNNFIHLGMPHAFFFTVLAGLIELAGAFSVGCGFLTRLGSFCLVLYLLVATYLGHHFSLGFIWASPGGGWEYPILWSSLIASFILFGGGGFSIDRALRSKYNVPRWIVHLMGSRHH